MDEVIDIGFILVILFAVIWFFRLVWQFYKIKAKKIYKFLNIETPRYLSGVKAQSEKDE